MSRRVVEQPSVIFAELDDVPSDVELCRDDRCRIDDLHPTHRTSRRGQKAKTKTCPTCKAIVPAGAPCPTCTSQET